MNAWLKNSIKNLLPLSQEKKDFNKALREWSFTGETIDYETPEELCQLCEMEGLRYHFQISNALHKTLWVGSQCIERFDIQVLDEEGEEVTKKDKEVYLKNKLRYTHLNAVIEVLSHVDSRDRLQEHIKKDLDNYSISKFTKGKIDARVLNYLFMRFEEEKIRYNKRFFSIDIRSKLNKDKLLSLTENQFNRIKASLSRGQINFYLSEKI